MSEFVMDGEELILSESPDRHQENVSMLSNGGTCSSSDIELSDDEPCKVISIGSEYKNDAAVCLNCSHSPSKEAPSDVLWMGPPPTPYSTDSKKSKFSCQTPGSPIHINHNEDECASLILACLFCQFYDFLLMLPHMCAHLWSRTCGNRCHKYNSDMSNNNQDCNCKCEFDCAMFDSCQETSDCLELALEISEVCYR